MVLPGAAGAEAGGSYDEREAVHAMPPPRKKTTRGTAAAAARSQPPTNADLVPEGQRPCPICGDHGVRLDRWELERVVAGHGVRARRRSDAAAAKAQREALWWPFGSLFGGRDG